MVATEDVRAHILGLQAQGFTRKQISDACRVSVRSLSAIVNGHVKATHRDIARRILDVSNANIDLTIT
jgi:hypothetical protein